VREASLKSYLPFAKGTFQSLLSYRLNFFLYVIGELTTVFATYYIWLAVYKNSGSQTLHGFSLQDMFTYIFMCQVALNFVSNDASYEVANEVREGSIAMNLIRPIRYRMVILFRILGEVIYNVCFVGTPILLIVCGVRYFSHGIAPDLLGIAGFFLSAVMGFLIYFYFNFIFGLSAFYISNVWGMNMLKGAIINFLSGSMIPIQFFPGWAQDILAFMPFNSLIYTPVMIFLGKYQGMEAVKALLIQVFWVLLLGISGVLLWQKAIKKLTIQGG
jgi:ABC-2 type transport system permease protein